MARKTPNQKQWLLSMEDIKKRLRRLERKGVDTSDIVLPEQPKRYTQKSLVKLGKVRDLLISKEKESKSSKILKARSNSMAEQMRKSRTGHSRTKMKASPVPSVLDVLEKYIRDRITDAYRKGSRTVAHLERALNDLIAVHGRKEVLARFQQGMDEGVINIDDILFGSDSEQLYTSFTDCVNYLVGDEEDLSDYVDLDTLATDLGYGENGGYEI